MFELANLSVGFEKRFFSFENTITEKRKSYLISGYEPKKRRLIKTDGIECAGVGERCNAIRGARVVLFL